VRFGLALDPHQKIGVSSLFLVDYHIHTKRCKHACGADREYVETAIRQGLREMGFADHIPRFYEPPDQDHKVAERGMSWIELEEYVHAVETLRGQYPEVRIKLGLEVDFVPGWERQIEIIQRQYPWDYLIGSVHFIPEWSYGYLPYEKDRTPSEVYPKYFEMVARAAESGLFDILGHIDLPKRGFKPLPPSEMTALYRQLAGRLGKVQAIVELNTYGLRCLKQGGVGIYPDEELARFCYQQGVQFTLGSDAHRPEDVGTDLSAACRMMRRIKIDRIATFERRRITLTDWEHGSVKERHESRGRNEK
jgi:histidinol-phosphatase (PHP family)